MDIRKHVERVVWKDVEKQVRELAPKLAQALDKFADRKSRESSASMFLARFGYGQLIVGSNRKATGRSIGVIPPCGDRTDLCSDCKELAEAGLAGRPLGIVLKNSLESYVEYANRGIDHDATRSIPLRVIDPGDIFGTLDILQTLSSSRLPHRSYLSTLRVSSGARSVFISLPLGGEDVGKILRSKLPSAIQRSDRRFRNDASLADAVDNDNWFFLRSVANAIALENGQNPWQSTVLLLPVSWLRERISDHQSLREEAKDFALLLYEASLKQSNNLRTHFFQGAALSDTQYSTSRTIRPDLYTRQNVDVILQHVLSIASGDFPGFFPIRQSDNFGPFTDILDYLLSCGLGTAKSIRGSFPAILAPRLVNLRPNEQESADAAYYSLRFPTFPGPFEEIRRPGQFFSDLHERLMRIERDMNGLFPPIKCIFAASKPVEGLEAGVPFVVNSTAEILRTDFDYQFQQASKWQVGNYEQFFPPTKSKFLSNFMRIQAKRYSAAQGVRVLT